jgi:hypothetical protein
MPGEEIAVHFMFKFFQWRDRDYIASLHERYDLEKLRATYGKRTFARVSAVLGSLVLLFAGAPALAYGLFLLLRRDLLREGDVQIVWSYLPQITAAALLGFIGAFAIILTMELLRARWLYQTRFHEYVAYECLRAGYNIHLRTIQLLLGIGLPCLVLAYLSVGTYTLFTSHSIVTNPFFGFNESRYSFDQITALNRRSYAGREDQRPVERFYHSISFKDGTEWSTRVPYSAVSPADLRKGEEILNYLSQQTGVPITKAPIDP